MDAVLDRLNEDSIAQTMILIKLQAQVGNRVNCAVHFLRYMKLGQPAGERKDNGFVFLIVVEPTRIDVHYGVGLGLPALTASELTTLNRAAEDAYQSTHSMDQALLTLVQGFDTVARSKYAPLIIPTPTPETINLPPLPSGPLGILSICCLMCMGDCLKPTDDVTNISAINWTASVASCPGYLYHPLVFIKFKANLVRLWIFSINSHTSERLIKGT